MRKRRDILASNADANLCRKLCQSHSLRGNASTKEIHWRVKIFFIALLCIQHCQMLSDVFSCCSVAVTSCCSNCCCKCALFGVVIVDTLLCNTDGVIGDQWWCCWVITFHATVANDDVVNDFADYVVDSMLNAYVYRWYCFNFKCSCSRWCIYVVAELLMLVILINVS